MHGIVPSGELGADVDARGPLEEGRIALLAGDFTRASRLADRVLASDSTTVEAWILKGRSLVCRYNPKGALGCYERALLLDPASSEVWRRKGFAHRLAGETREALASWRRALELEPGDHRTLMHMGSALDELGQFSNAIDCYERVLAHDPDHSYARESLLLNNRILKRLAEASEAKPRG